MHAGTLLRTHVFTLFLKNHILATFDRMRGDEILLIFKLDLF